MELLLESILRLATPIAFAALAGCLAERSGIINIALEGHMLMGAFFGAAIAYWTGSTFLGWWMGGLAGGIFGLLFAYLVVVLRADQIIAGAALNMLALGVTPLLCHFFFDSSISTPTLDGFMPMGHWAYTILLMALLLISFLDRFTGVGILWRFSGENPASLQALGRPLLSVRTGSLLMSGILAGLGGATLSVVLSSSFVRAMTSGRGFMALAALIIGKWKPIPAVLAAVFLGAIDALQIRLEWVSVPTQVTQALPYILTLVALAGVFGASRAPKALGKVLIVFLGFFLAGCTKKEPKEYILELGSARELASEVYSVVFQEEPEDVADFERWASILRQGATLEGMHNGLTHSELYRKKETTTRGATPSAIDYFSREMRLVQNTLTVSRRSSSEPIESKPNQFHAQEDISSFIGASIFTLKRVLSEETLKLIAEKASYPENLAKWYAEFAVRYATLGVFYGLPMRMRSDENFHYGWAIHTTRDRITWEVLNRLHRQLNDLNRR